MKGNPYKESAYGIYHNGCLGLMDVLCSSATPQEKVTTAMNMIVNMRSEIRVSSEKITANRIKKSA
jgi:hypothetical protein